jgi:8-oxo-dGTP pyrophosphatase MutT (NUDIX family)
MADQPRTPAKRAARRPTPRSVEETSAGGFVLDRSALQPQAALIARRDRRGQLVWSLPKGHIEEGETPETAAIREVLEETGITGRILASLGTIDFWFMADTYRVHKTVHHYVLEAQDRVLSDADPEVVEVAWVPLDEVAARLRYADERRLVERVQAVLVSLEDGSGTPAP